MKESLQLRTVVGFAVAAALFLAIDGYLIGEIRGSAVPGAIAGAILGALLGAGIAILAWQRRPQDDVAYTAAPADHHTNYMAIWAALFALTVVEVGVAFLAFAKIVIILVLIGLAAWKALLVALYYMHLKYEPRRMWLLAASPLPLALILIAAVLMEGWRG
jgi:cytochrome c oxidase subunit 4